jgi:hypothetical protein
MSQVEGESRWSCKYNQACLMAELISTDMDHNVKKTGEGAYWNVFWMFETEEFVLIPASIHLLTAHV